MIEFKKQLPLAVGWCEFGLGGHWPLWAPVPVAAAYLFCCTYNSYYLTISFFIIGMFH